MHGIPRALLCGFGDDAQGWPLPVLARATPSVGLPPPKVSGTLAPEACDQRTTREVPSRRNEDHDANCGNIGNNLGSVRWFPLAVSERGQGERSKYTLRQKRQSHHARELQKARLRQDRQPVTHRTQARQQRNRGKNGNVVLLRARVRAW